jgi:uncharacterized membrane protein HdeD (DUF308 family)
MKLRDIGMLLLAVFLIILGLELLLNLTFSGLNILEGLLALAAGVLIAAEPIMGAANSRT